MYKLFLKILIIIIIQLMLVPTISKAGFWQQIFDEGKDFLETGKSESKSNQANDITTQHIVNDLYNILFPLGVATTVIVGGALGIKFMWASADDKAKIKESLIPYGVGCVVIYGAFGIWRIAIEIFSKL